MGSFGLQRGRTMAGPGVGRLVTLLIVFALVAVACDPGSADGNDAGVAAGSCDDRSGDVAARRYKGAIPDHADLQRVEVSSEDDALVLRYELGGPPPSDKKQRDAFPFMGVSFTALVDDRPRYSVGAPLYDSKVNAWEYTKKPKPEDKIKSLDASSGTVDVEGSEVTISLPLSVVPALEDGFSWFASAGARQTRTGAVRESELADFCPNLSESQQGRLGRPDTKVPQRILDKLPTGP